jgi:hypothetical protein
MEVLKFTKNQCYPRDYKRVIGRGGTVPGLPKRKIFGCWEDLCDNHPFIFIVGEISCHHHEHTNYAWPLVDFSTDVIKTLAKFLIYIFRIVLMLIWDEALLVLLVILENFTSFGGCLIGGKSEVVMKLTEVLPNFWSLFPVETHLVVVWWWWWRRQRSWLEDHHPTHSVQRML